MINKEDYPDRKIIYVENKKKLKMSYGIVLFSKNTNRYLAVKKRNTYGYCRILSGMYKSIDCDNLLKQFTSKEAIKLILNHKNKISFRYLLDECNVHTNEFTIDCSLSKIKELNIVYRCKKYLLDDLLSNEIKWSWPKGSKEGDESKLTCALRELYEETGINMSKRPYILRKSFICNEFMSEELIMYQNKMFLLEIDDEIELSNVHIGEIVEAKWVTSYEFKSNCNESYLRYIDSYM